MEEVDETTNNENAVRRTRSTRSAKAAKTSPKPAPKTRGRGRKKVVLMEVEVSEEDEEAQQAETSENEQTTEDEQKTNDFIAIAEEMTESALKESIKDELDRSLTQEESETGDYPDKNEEAALLAEEVEEKNDLDNMVENFCKENNKPVNENGSSELSSVGQNGNKTEENVTEDPKDLEESNEILGKVGKSVTEKIKDTESTAEECVENPEELVKQVQKLSEAEEPMDISQDELADIMNVAEASSTETEPKESIASEPETIVASTNELNTEETTVTEDKTEESKVSDAENISEDELPGVPVVKVPETEEVSDDELPGPKRAELPADTEVVSEDELPTVKKEGTKRKLPEGEYDPSSPSSEGEGVPSKKQALDPDEVEKKEEEKPATPKKLPELDKYWKAVNDDPTDFTGWTYLLQYVDQENDMEAAREAYDAFLSHYPYCYGYWRKYADYEKRKGNKKKCEEVFERGLKAIPLSVDLWIHYLTYVKTSRSDDESYIRSQFERAVSACGLEFRSDRLWDSYIKWENEAKRLPLVTALYDRLLATPTQGYTAHFESFQEHITLNGPNKVIDVDEFIALRKDVRTQLKNETAEADSDAPPGDEESQTISSDEETKAVKEKIISIRRKIHKATVAAVSARWNFEEGIKRPYFHVKPLERCQLKNWQDYLDFEVAQGDKTRIVVLFERCLIACALYEEFWLKFVYYLEGLKDESLLPKIREVYERACTIHHLKKPNLHLQWAMFEENYKNFNKAAEILVNLEKSVPNLLQVAYRRINLERRRGENDKCVQLYETYIANCKNKMLASNVAIKYSRFCFKVMKDFEKACEVLKTAIEKDPTYPRLYLQLLNLLLHDKEAGEKEVIALLDSFLEKENAEMDQKLLFAQRKLEFLEDFGADLESVSLAFDEYQKLLKQSKDSRKKDAKVETAAKKEKSSAASASQPHAYPPQGGYQYSSSQPQGYAYPQYGQGEQYQYQNWQYPQGGYGGYNQWGAYGGGYGY